MAKKETTRLPAEKVAEIKKSADALISVYGEQEKLFQRYREIYFMDNMEKPKNGSVDERDWKLTPSPSGRNEVIGMQRLLNTAELQVEVKNSQAKDKIEEGLKKMLYTSSEGKMARVEADAMLSAVLYGPVTLYAESVADLLAVKDIPEYKKKHLAKMMKKTPFLIRTINPEESFSERDEGLMIKHVWRYTLKGSKLKARWGVAVARDEMDYEVRDVFTPEYHVVYSPGIATEHMAAPHNLGCIPVVSSYAGGSELFHKPDQQINSYLYAKAKGEMDKRENSVLTALFTAINMRGLLGPLVAVDPDAQGDKPIEVSYQGGIRVIKAKAQPVDDKVIDPVVFQAWQMLQELGGESTIYKQTLGQNLAGSTFSGLAMLSSAGKLPMVDSQRALEGAFKDIFLHILYRIKDGGIENDLIPPSIIPDDPDIEVTFKPKLPQDDLRNAQVITNLGDKVSDEYVYQNFLQINDPAAMQKQIAKEKIKKALVEAMVSNPQVMQQLMAKIVPPPPPAPVQPNAAPGGLQDPNMPPMAPEGMQAGPGMEQMPKMDAMIPPEERM